MFVFMREHQLNIMMCLVAICTIIAISIGISNNLSKKRKILMIAMALAVAILLEFDRAAYMFRGEVSNVAYLWVRVANFSVFALSIGVQYLFNEYLIDLITHEGGFTSAPKRLVFNRYLSALGILLLIFSQFTGWYYTFDEYNRYQRGPGFVVCYLVPMLIFLILLTADAKYTKEIHRNLRISLFAFVVLPLSASIVQVFTYGLSLTNISLAIVVIIIYVFALMDANETIEIANKIKIGHLKEDQESLYRLFEQTATAFVSAIDAKDKYTKGHSVRVGKYAKTLAEMAGKSKEECRNIYYAALLHEIGKIAIPDSILSKDKSLTDEEYAVLKQYPTIGRDILSSITEFPFLAEGAMYHHERYDGTGYPEGLAGEEIPELARIIAVADAYDTMTSQRSYRDPIPQQKVREEFVKGMGTQFDPEYTKL
ncbi:MAG: HD domain-containing protein, partial [Lachnospiraceae bacterium]|nr:HD domain-containing protein [Lachnospiraceae bacterium]